MKRVLLLAFAAVLGASAASAGVSMNGTSLNGIVLNGISINGASLNGLSFNGLSLNGACGGEVPVNPEGAGDVAALVVQAFRLADGTRLAVAPAR